MLTQVSTFFEVTRSLHFLHRILSFYVEIMSILLVFSTLNSINNVLCILSIRAMFMEEPLYSK